MKLTRRPSARAFTLVELLVVIGIIAALIGILLPVLSGVQARGRDLKCQSNLRQIVQAMIGYSSENKGALPWGIVWNRANNRVHPDPYNSANNWSEASDNVNSEFFCATSLIGKYMAPKSDGLYGNVPDDGDLGQVFQCPEAAQGIQHYIGYAFNMITTVSPQDELRQGPAPRAQLKPALISQSLKDGTALLWDTAQQPGWYADDIIGYVVGADIDGQRFWGGAFTPQWRYFNQKDPFGFIPPGQFGQNKPIQLTTQGGVIWSNIDPQDDASFPYQGNLRFRHNKGTTCNAGFADGSVRQFTGKFKGDKQLLQEGVNPTHDALRKFFMIKWPAGVPARPGVPV